MDTSISWQIASEIYIWGKLLAVPVPRIWCFFTPGSGIRDGKKSGSGKNIPDHISQSLVIFLGSKYLKFFFADTGSGVPCLLTSGIRDPGWKNSDPRSRIRDEYTGSAELAFSLMQKLTVIIFTKKTHSNDLKFLLQPCPMITVQFLFLICQF